MKLRTIAPLVLVALLAIGITGIAIGSSPEQAESIVASPPSVSLEVLENFKTFRTPSTESPKERDELVKFIKDSTDIPVVANIDFSYAKSIDVGVGRKAWIAPSQNSVCAIAPVEPDGYGASCATLADVKAGRGIMINTPGRNSTNQNVEIVAILADGMAAPYVLGANNKRTALKFTSNTAFASIPPTGILKTEAGDIDIESLAQNQP